MNRPGVRRLVHALFYAASAVSAVHGQARAPTVAALTVQHAIVVDGLLSEPDWQRAELVSLTQSAPHPGEPTAYTTVFRVLIDRSHLYIGVECNDPSPATVATHVLQFDSDESNDDRLTVVLDTFGRHRTGYKFDVNAAGARADGLISPSSSEPSYDWNGDWNARVQRTATGWSAEFAIDTRSLQFPTNAAKWGLNIMRYVPREQLSLQWAGNTLDSKVTDLSRAGTIEGMGGLQQSLGWEVAPYGLISNSSGAGRTSSQKGLDVRYNITPDMAAILTVNPDFAEAQVDARQLNLTPYALFLSEKRQFFLEGSNQFTFGYGISSTFQPFYSRTVGLFDGTAVPLDEGLKVIGQAGAWSIGALAVQTGSASQTAHENLRAGRVTYDVDQQLRIGTIVTQGNPSGVRDNSFIGLDAVWHTSTFRNDKNLDISGWVGKSSGQLSPGQQAGWGIYVDYPNDLWRWVFSENTFGDALEPALGFLPRPGTHQYDLYAGYYPRPEGEYASWLRQVFYELEYIQIDDLYGATQTRQWFVTPFNIHTAVGSHYEFHWAPEHEALSAPFEIARGVILPAGEYSFYRYHLQAASPASWDWRLGSEAEFGTFYDGRLIQLKPFAVLSTSGGNLHLEANVEIDRGRLREGEFLQRLYQIKASYSFNPDITLSTFVQYDDLLDHVGVNAQLHWIAAAQRDLFLIFDRNVTPSLSSRADAGPNAGNSLTLKLRWSFRM